MEKVAENDILKKIEERQKRLSDGVSIIQRKHSFNGVPEAYKDARCTSPNQWIYLYPDGHEELVEINTASMIPTIIK